MPSSFEVFCRLPLSARLKGLLGDEHLSSRVASAVAAALVVLMSVCCGGSVPGPHPIALGKDTCAKCRNTITSLDAAAQIVHADDRVVFYDDLGCLATDLSALEGGGQFYVQFAGGKGWARVEDVHFAYTQEEARAIDPNGWARGWQDVVGELGRR